MSALDEIEWLDHELRLDVLMRCEHAKGVLECVDLDEYGDEDEIELALSEIESALEQLIEGLRDIASEYAGAVEDDREATGEADGAGLDSELEDGIGTLKGVLAELGEDHLSALPRALAAVAEVTSIAPV